VAKTDLCVDSLDKKTSVQVELRKCKENFTFPGDQQTFHLRETRDIFFVDSDDKCLKIKDKEVWCDYCEKQNTAQYFRYDVGTKQIFCGFKRDNKCIQADTNQKKLFVGDCHRDEISQKWNWGFVNETMLRNWVDYGKNILDEQEIDDLK
jgi:hypothetical protein